MDLYGQALLLDGSILAVCATLLLVYGNLSFSHPAIAYLTFHVYVVTLRLVALLTGDGATLFSKWVGPFDVVTPVEIARAAAYCDMALVSMTVMWLWMRRMPSTGPPQQSSVLIPSRVWVVIVLSFLVGLVGLVMAAQLPGFQPNRRSEGLGVWASSSYLMISQTWCGLALLAYIYCYGFKKVPLALLGLYLMVMVFQGYHRFRVVIPVLMLSQIWLDRRHLRWPPRWMVGALIVVGLLFFPLKSIGRMWQTGASLEDIGTVVSASTQQVIAGEADDQMFLDQLGSALTLVDMKAKKYWGTPYLSLITLPIPRQWWPDKPGLSDYLVDLSIPSRPMSDMGMIVTFVGEAYANFGIFGIILVPPLLAAGLIAFYRKAYRAGYHSVVRFAYILVCGALIQVYRDGLISLILFTFVNSLPLVVIVLLHFIPRLAPTMPRHPVPSPGMDRSSPNS